MNKFTNFHKAMLIATGALLVGIIFNVIFKQSDLLLFNRLSNICFLIALFIQITALIFLKPAGNTSDILTNRDKAIKGIIIVSSGILTIIIFIFFIYYLL